MDPVRFAVSRPYTVAVGVILVVLFSVLAFRRIPVQLKPTVDPPIIQVRTVYPGAGPVEVEEQITRKLEDLLQGAEGLDKLSSASMDGISTVALEYAWGVDKDRALIDVINKLSQLPDLPPDAEEPVVSLSGSQGEGNSMWILVRSRYSPSRVRQLVIEEIEPRLERVEGVAELMIIGGAEREVRVLVDPERLAARRIGFAELASALRRGYQDRRGGTVETGVQQLVVRTEGRSSDLASIEEILVRRDAAGVTRVGDVARVVDDHKEIDSIVHSEGASSVVIGVGRQVGANVVTMIDGVSAEMERLNERFRERGLDLELVSVYRDTTYLREALGFVQSNLLLGAGLAVLILLLFLRSVRSVLVVGLSIPISLLAVFLVMNAMGRTLNVISLAGLAFASGMVVDNAIVVLENIFRHLEMGKNAREAAVDGGREVWGGVLAATLTTIAVFVPILAIEEEAGQLFADLALAIAAAVALSLVVALTVVPTLAAIFFRRGRKSGESGDRVAKSPGRMVRAYGAAAGVLSARGRGPVLCKLGLLLLVVAGALWTLRIVPAAGYLPTGNRNLILYIGQPVPGMRPEAVEANLAGLERWVLGNPKINRYFLVVAGSFNGGGVVLEDEYSDGPGLEAFQAEFMPICMAVPGFRYLIPMQMSLFRDSGKQFTLEITGPDLDRLAMVASTLEERLQGFPGLQPGRVQSNYVEGRPELRVQIDHHRATEARMSVQEVGQVVEAAVAGSRVGTYSEGGRDYDLLMVVPPERVSSAEDLAAMPVVTPAGSLTTLGSLASVERASGPQSVNRLERERAITLTVNLLPDAALQQVLNEVHAQIVRPLLGELPADYRIELGGTADKFSSTLSALMGSFWLAILITYLLLVALFRSWLSPVVILVTVPLALSGGLLGIALASANSPNASFDLLAMLGFVILAGVVVNNAILIIHQSNNLRLAGQERRAALTESAQSRLRPILMSVMTSVFAMLPLAIGTGSGSELYQGLAAVVVGGLVVSTVFTLFLVPALVSLGWDFQDLLRGERATAPA
ncbi:MAG TPA: efflux RND transporter permease subunit [Planctomycetota bacterium]